MRKRKAAFIVWALFLLLAGFNLLQAEGGGGEFTVKKSRMVADNYIIDQVERDRILYTLALIDQYDYFLDEYFSVYKIIVFDKRSSFFVDEKVLTKIPHHNLAPTPQRLVLKEDALYVEWLTFDNDLNQIYYLKKGMDYYKSHEDAFDDTTYLSNDLYASLAVSTTRYKFAYSYKYDSLYEAEERALNICNDLAKDNSCFTLVSAKNQCIAFAAYQRYYGWGRADTKEEAKRYALDYCKMYSGTNCELLMAVCADGR